MADYVAIWTGGLLSLLVAWRWRRLKYSWIAVLLLPMALLDAYEHKWLLMLTGMVPGVVGDEQSVEADSFVRGVLDFPHYTRPAEFEGRRVPDVLLSGHHAEIRRWRRQQALRRTWERRPDLLATAQLDEEERGWLRAWASTPGSTFRVGVPRSRLHPPFA